MSKQPLRPDLALIAEWIKPGARVLDLGCGDGLLLDVLQRERAVRGYGVEIDDEQIAWWRWLTSEQRTDEAMALQEYPWTEVQAFQASGAQFFSKTELSRLYTEVNKAAKDNRAAVLAALGVKGV